MADKLIGQITISNAAPSLERWLRKEAKKRNLSIARTAELCLREYAGIDKH